MTTREWCYDHGYQDFYDTNEGLTCPVCLPPPGQHVDDFVSFGSNKPNDQRDPNEKYARWFMMLHRLPAIMQSAFTDQIGHYKLFCTYQGELYRVTGASRLGDICLTKDLNKDIGYEIRVFVNECSGWSASH
jgi:hypothetical protein